MRKQKETDQKQQRIEKLTKKLELLRNFKQMTEKLTPSKNSKQMFKPLSTVEIPKGLTVEQALENRGIVESDLKRFLSNMTTEEGEYIKEECFLNFSKFPLPSGNFFSDLPTVSFYPPLEDSSSTKDPVNLSAAKISAENLWLECLLQTINFLNTHPEITKLKVSEMKKDISVKEEKEFLSDLTIETLSILIAQNKTLKSINLENNDLESRDLVSLFESIVNNKTLTSINLSFNNFGPEGGKYIAKLLIQNSSITNMTCANNNLGDDGAKFFIDVIAKNTSLTNLDLHFNNIGSKGMKAFAKIISKNKTLVFLNLLNDFSFEYNKEIMVSLEKIQNQLQLNKQLYNLLPKISLLLCLIFKRNKTLYIPKFILLILSHTFKLNPVEIKKRLKAPSPTIAFINNKSANISDSSDNELLSNTFFNALSN